MNAPKIELKNLKTMEGRDGLAFSATLYVDGKKAAYATQEGHGGCTFINWVDGRADISPTAKRVAQYAASLPPIEPPDELAADGMTPMAMDTELLIDQMVDDALTMKRLKRLCRTNTVFRVEGETRKGEWEVVSIPWGDRARAWIASNLPGRKVEVANERFV